MKRRVCILLLCIGVGVVANVAVAWALALRDVDEWYRAGWWGELEMEDVAFSKRFPAWTPWADAEDAAALGGTIYRPGASLTLTSRGRWIKDPSGREVAEQQSELVVRSGFPFPSLRRDVVGLLEPNAPTIVYEPAPGAWGGIPLPDRGPPATPGSLGATLPCVPLLGATLANVSLYGLAFFVVFLAPRRMRRRLLRSEGRCVRCTYPIDPDGLCAECGTRADAPPPDARSSARRPLVRLLLAHWMVLWRTSVYLLIGAALTFGVVRLRMTWPPNAMPVGAWPAWDGTDGSLVAVPEGSDWIPVERGTGRARPTTLAFGGSAGIVRRTAFERSYWTGVHHRDLRSSRPTMDVAAIDRIGWPLHVVQREHFIPWSPGRRTRAGSPDWMRPAPSKSDHESPRESTRSGLLATGVGVNSAFYALLSWLLVSIVCLACRKKRPVP